ncbi:alanine--tRNA ligase [Clostridium formicaceticum]|uniref:Alanine--tRNA ligase n=1 Tax=Clostridium formicaceticum TaxID=1497 RepID=A0AAC9RM40_9CLOT|nr:alanine--tRNA ligase [Clostridium formicaceticum]AOY76999.1 alanine--tRNA ligase [Clostridium formicaceticum]ARE87488.1 Alanine--tRNA ligase [Clostridium formicaceticum]
MEKKGLNEIRQLFLDFFKSKDHLVRPSYPLVPQNDKSLLLINAGMAPLKPYFAGTEVPPNKRMATCQKCIRTGDIENVGYTARHATFFEMLGNFSFGDYFKEESILWGWEFVTEYLKMPVDKLWASIYLDDEEAYKIWHKKVGISEDKIVRLGKEDNFWEIGVGPCGPCSEIYFDRGEKYGCGKADCKPGCDCDRYVEFWNHVFTQFDRDEAGNYNLLPNPNIDTGMGLERVACIMQNVDSIFEVDTMKYILDQVCQITASKYNEDERTNISIRIITDHIRSVTFMVSDGILPSNEGRGYVLRRLLRRAARHGKILGVEKSFLYQLVDAVIKMYGEMYTELREKEDYIKRVIQVEEERFQETIHQGLDILNQYIKELQTAKESILTGELAFKLYDTYGFPLDLTKEILEEKGLGVDIQGFEEEMTKQRERARQARGAGDTEGWKEDAFSSLNMEITTNFKGYEEMKNKGKVLAIVKENTVVEKAEKGEEVIVILDETTFYGEGGGQVGDVGSIYNEVFQGTVTDTKKGINQRIHQVVIVKEGTLRVGDTVVTEVEEKTRKNTARNHTATHLLHKALKEVVGEHVQQAGSLVTPERLRFDFTHFEGLTTEEIKSIEEKINQQIMVGLEVGVLETTPNEAKKMGAEALFGEKYGEIVRVVKVGDYSIELCGGTHIKNSSEIGMFLILSEGGIASGVRRIEAVTGREAYTFVKSQQNTLQKSAELLKTSPNNVASRLEGLVAEVKEKDREISRLKAQLAMGAVDELLEKIQIIQDIKVIITKVDVEGVEDLRKLGDTLKEKMQSGVVLLASETEDKVIFIATATKDLLGKGVHAGNLVKEAAKVTGGGGGGRPDMAQAGGKNPEKIKEALEAAEELLKKQLNG